MVVDGIFMATPILFSSRDRTVFVLDIPSSLESGNGGGRIRSTKAIDTPYATPEPKGKKREAFIAALPIDQAKYHETLQAEIAVALQLVRESWTQTEWCLARIECESVQGLPCFDAPDSDIDTDLRECLPVVLSTLRNDFSSDAAVANQVVLNPNVSPTLMRLSGTKHIRIPQQCAFIWSSIKRGYIIMQEHAKDSGIQFDLILMDPPWSNRSVRNRANYSTAEKQDTDPFAHAMMMVKKFQKPHAHGAIWITNKASIRAHVLESMAVLGYILKEEWIWVKVTGKGEPVTPLDGVWRRPYELLLIFHHDQIPCIPLRRFIFATPDVHSRKPNLAELFHALIQPSNVLELFARYLTSGWWCLGDQVLRFQDQISWHDEFRT